MENLDLMRRLAAYAEGEATWFPTGDPLGEHDKKACAALHANLVCLVDQLFAPLLDRINAREMDTFTMHDRRHALKVSHLMWHILAPQRRDLLTPPEIGLMVVSAHFHDLGMALSRSEREKRLAVDSDLWVKLELLEGTKEQFENLQWQVGDERLPASLRRSAKSRLDQAEEVLLCLDTRERHATRERYEELFSGLRDLHKMDASKVADIDVCVTFDGDSFTRKLIEICISHNEDAEALARLDVDNPSRPRFPRDFPVGGAVADLHMVAAALRMADILDFDRERTPAVLFPYLLPGPLAFSDEKSSIEWRKHLAISNWDIQSDEIVFRGRCGDHVIHHAIVHFCRNIESELVATRATFTGPEWEFAIPTSVKPDVHEEGYRYVPYRFELDDERIYALLMGGAIYDNPLVALRELVQNAVDACLLRDSLTQMNEPFMQPAKTNRIFVRYVEPLNGGSCPELSVIDHGTGMDAFAIENYFLKVGRSFYQSTEFRRDRVILRQHGLDFAPVSQFGIGFLSCFLLADRIKVETAMFEPRRGDTRKRTLFIDGPTRLIRMDEQANTGHKAFRGTAVTMFLRRGQNGLNPSAEAQK